MLHINSDDLFSADRISPSLSAIAFHSFSRKGPTSCLQGSEILHRGPNKREFLSQEQKTLYIFFNLLQGEGPKTNTKLFPSQTYKPNINAFPGTALTGTTLYNLQASERYLAITLTLL